MELIRGINWRSNLDFGFSKLITVGKIIAVDQIRGPLALEIRSPKTNGGVEPNNGLLQFSHCSFLIHGPDHEIGVLHFSHIDSIGRSKISMTLQYEIKTVIQYRQRVYLCWC